MDSQKTTNFTVMHSDDSELDIIVYKELKNEKVTCLLKWNQREYE